MTGESEPSCFKVCGQTILDHFASQGVGISAVTRRPGWMVPNGYEPLNLTCPHGARWHAEPSSEQRARWAADGVE